MENKIFCNKPIYNYLTFEPVLLNNYFDSKKTSDHNLTFRNSGATETQYNTTVIEAQNRTAPTKQQFHWDKINRHDLEPTFMPKNLMK